MAGKSSACAEPRGRLSRWRGMVVLGLVALLSLGIGLSFGSVAIPLDRLWRGLTGSDLGADPLAWEGLVADAAPSGR